MMICLHNLNQWKKTALLNSYNQNQKIIVRYQGMSVYPPLFLVLGKLIGPQPVPPLGQRKMTIILLQSFTHSQIRTLLQNQATRVIVSSLRPIDNLREELYCGLQPDPPLDSKKNPTKCPQPCVRQIMSNKVLLLRNKL